MLLPFLAISSRVSLSYHAVRHLFDRIDGLRGNLFFGKCRFFGRGYCAIEKIRSLQNRFLPRELNAWSRRESAEFGTYAAGVGACRHKFTSLFLKNVLPFYVNRGER